VRSAEIEQQQLALNELRECVSSIERSCVAALQVQSNSCCYGKHKMTRDTCWTSARSAPIVLVGSAATNLFVAFRFPNEIAAGVLTLRGRSANYDNWMDTEMKITREILEAANPTSAGTSDKQFALVGIFRPIPKVGGRRLSPRSSRTPTWSNSLR